MEYVTLEEAKKLRLEALIASCSLPHDSLGELLKDADRIENWLYKPIDDQRKKEQQRHEAFMKNMELLKKII